MTRNEIEKEVNDLTRYYIAPIRAYTYMKFLLSELSKMEERVKELEKEAAENLTVWKAQQLHGNCLTVELEQAESRLQKLHKLVEEHKNSPWWIRLNMKHDTELYREVEEIKREKK